jgi:hypothetical protein
VEGQRFGIGRMGLLSRRLMIRALGIGGEAPHSFS